MKHDPFEVADGRRVNPSTQPAIADIIDVRVSRRAALQSIGAASLFGLFGCGTMATGSGASADGSAALGFTEVGRTTDDKAHVAPGHNLQVLIRHGDPIHRGAPQYRPALQTGADQERQFGTDNDFLAFMPLPRGSNSSTRGLLGVNHENHRAVLCFPGVTSQTLSQLTREQCEVQMAAQGFSIIEIQKSGHSWRLVDDSPYNRRLSVNAVMRAAGPAAGSTRLRTNADPSGTRILGTFNNCAGGTTPWGTILTAEENFQNYFAGNAGQGPEAAARKRYGVSGRGRYVAWGRHFDRFNLDKEPNEPNRFGWIVEIDPYDPKSTPVKRTALGRCAHECATSTVSHDGRVAIYSGDDARMEYVYKFVTQGGYDATRPEANRDLLDSGTLYAARFEANGKMRWLPLVHGQG